MCNLLMRPWLRADNCERLHILLLHPAAGNFIKLLPATAAKIDERRDTLFMIKLLSAARGLLRVCASERE